MLKTPNNIHDFYKMNDEDQRLKRAKVNNVEFLTTLKYLEQVCPLGATILDACAGTGIYAFYLARKGYQVTAGDLVACNVKKMHEEQKKSPVLEKIYTGSILDLSIFADESFDVVLNLGAYYHLTKEVDRIKAMEESLRVLKPGGIVGMAYLNRYANIIKFREQMKEDFDAVEEYFMKGHNKYNSIFYASTPGEIELLMDHFHVEKVYNIGTDGLKFIMRDTVNSLNDEEFDRWMKIHYQMCETESLLGYSEHGLYIGKKL